jgi:hypothetical protein
MRTALTAVAFVALGALPVAASERMIAADIQKTFSGMTLDGVYNDNSYFSETYNDDGTIRYHDTEQSDSGQWTVKGNTFCTFYQLQEGACFFVERDGDNCFTFFEAIKGDNGQMSEAKDWTSRGWDRKSPDTCPSKPGVEI